MAYYDYQCLECGKIEEITASMSDDPVKVAPKCNCNKKKMNRVIGAPAIIMAGKNLTIGDMIDKGQVQEKPREWFEEQSRNSKRNRTKRDFEK